MANRFHVSILISIRTVKVLEYVAKVAAVSALEFRKRNVCFIVQTPDARFVAN